MPTDTEKEFDRSIKITKNTFNILGINLGRTKCVNFVTKRVYIFHMVWVYLGIFGEFFWLAEGIKMGKSFDDLSMILPCFVISVMATVKSLLLFHNKVILENAFKTLRRIHNNYIFDNENGADAKKDGERKFVMASIKFLETVIMFIYISCTIVIVMFTCEPLIFTAYMHYNTGEIKLKLPFLMKYFFDPYANKPIYIFVYIHQIWAGTLVSCNMLSADTLLYTFCSYLSIHFRILCHRLENCICLSREETKDNVRKCLNRHQELIGLVDMVEILYSKSTLFNITCSTLLLCLSGFNIMVVHKLSGILTYIPFLVLSLTQIVLFCFFGELLMSSSMQISEAVYNCLWYNAERDIKNSLLIILCRSQKPCKLTAFKFADINLRMLTAILSRSWSCFAVLRTMYD